ENRTPLARIRSYASAGVPPRIMGMGPVPAVRSALQRAGVELRDIELFELNEAFAAQSVAVGRELAIPEDRLNVNGGAIALGHPIGASGTRILVTLLHEMAKRVALAQDDGAAVHPGGHPLVGREKGQIRGVLRPERRGHTCILRRLDRVLRLRYGKRGVVELLNPPRCAAIRVDARISGLHREQ